MSPDHMQQSADTTNDMFPPGLEDGLSVTSSFPTKDPLVLGLVEALHSLLSGYLSSIRATLEMKHILLLLIKTFHDLCEQMAFEKDAWLQEIRETVDQQGSSPKTTREQTGAIIADKIKAAPWGLTKRPDQSRSDTAHTILAIYKAVVVFVKALEAGLEQRAQQGFDLKKYDVEEMQSEEEEEEEDDAQAAHMVAKVPKIIIHPPKPPKSDTASPPAPSSSRKTPGKGSGNYNHGMFTVWTIAEWVHLLKLYWENPTLMGKQMAQMHNDGYWVPKGRTVKRSTDSVRQQYKKLMGKGTKEETIGKIPEKIRELEGRVTEVGRRGGDGEEEGV
ncbi:hypothetical protein M409DRAFT_25854 [Zasmidium cellare ATCC 36951]|uniref:Uncharacterized protein n=1 Tax=Zasmidium cellare ATCC 36951 TaxID=1080233 RepID=A0A6A6CE15_ZASCE|nr:uncharacterized protein M409DRAFT_25854 [Zasmidium cellare ATCC 36951]KAF2163666.1 hypothetical protein M409DRAFT_25854 [Zasmidium cellare ATCC 36951]